MIKNNLSKLEKILLPLVFTGMLSCANPQNKDTDNIKYDSLVNKYSSGEVYSPTGTLKKDKVNFAMHVAEDFEKFNSKYKNSDVRNLALYREAGAIMTEATFGYLFLINGKDEVMFMNIPFKPYAEILDFDANKLNQAKEIYLKAIKADHSKEVNKKISYLAYGMLGKISEIEGKKYEAAKYYQKALELTPRDNKMLLEFYKERSSYLK